MAVDFSLLPPQEPEPTDPPSGLVWGIAFLVLALAGVFTALLLWPKGWPTGTLKFWIAVTLFPVGIPALLVLRRFSHYEGRRLDTALRNEASHGYNDRVFTAASRPLAIAGAAHRFSVDRTKNPVETILAGSVKPETREPVARGGEPVKARWFEVPDVALEAGTEEDDHNRQRVVTQWLFGELLMDIATQIKALPSRLDLDVHLLASGGLAYSESEALWNACWHEQQFRHARVAEAVPEAADLLSLDRWLDQVIEEREQQARLIVAVQLHPLLAGTPPAGTAEAGVAVLLVPDALAGRHDIARKANVYRPVRGTFSGPSGTLSSTLSHALQWAGAAAADIPGGWQTALDPTQAGAVREPAVRLGLAAQATDLDQTVGRAGVAAPWLALACAAGSLSKDVGSQVVFAGHAQGVDCAVVRVRSQTARS